MCFSFHFNKGMWLTIANPTKTLKNEIFFVVKIAIELQSIIKNQYQVNPLKYGKQKKKIRGDQLPMKLFFHIS